MQQSRGNSMKTIRKWGTFFSPIALMQLVFLNELKRLSILQEFCHKSSRFESFSLADLVVFLQFFHCRVTPVAAQQSFPGNVAQRESFMSPAVCACLGWGCQDPVEANFPGSGATWCACYRGAWAPPRGLTADYLVASIAVLSSLNTSPKQYDHFGFVVLGFFPTYGRVGGMFRVLCRKW